MSETHNLLASYNPYIHLDVLRDLVSSSGAPNGSGLGWQNVSNKLRESMNDAKRIISTISAYLKQYDNCYINTNITLLEMKEKMTINEIALVELQFFQDYVFRTANTKEKYDSYLYNGAPMSSEHVVAAFREVNDNFVEENQPLPVLMEHEVGESNVKQYNIRRENGKPTDGYTPSSLLGPVSTLCSGDIRSSNLSDKYGIKLKRGQEVIKVDFPDGEEWPSHPVGVLTRNIVICYKCFEEGHIVRYCPKRPGYWRDKVQVQCDQCILSLSKNTRYFIVNFKCHKCERPFKLYYDDHDKLERERRDMRGGAKREQPDKSGNDRYLKPYNIREWRAREGASERVTLQSSPRTPQRLHSTQKLVRPSPVDVRPPQISDNNLAISSQPINEDLLPAKEPSYNPTPLPTQPRFQPLLSILNAAPFGVPNCTKNKSVGNRFHDHEWVPKDGVWMLHPSRNRQKMEDYLQGKKLNESTPQEELLLKRQSTAKSSRLNKPGQNLPSSLTSPSLPLLSLPPPSLTSPSLPLLSLPPSLPSPENTNLHSLHTQENIHCSLDDMTIDQMLSHEAAHREQHQLYQSNSQTSNPESKVEEIMSRFRRKKVSQKVNASVVNESIAIVEDETNASQTIRATANNPPQQITKDIVSVGIGTVKKQHVSEAPPVQAEEITLSSDSDSDNGETVNGNEPDNLDINLSFRFEKYLHRPFTSSESSPSSITLIENLIRMGDFHGFAINTLQESPSSISNLSMQVPLQEDSVSHLTRGSNWHTIVKCKADTGLIEETNKIKEEPQTMDVSQNVNPTNEEIQVSVQNGPAIALNAKEAIVPESEPSPQPILLTFERLEPDKENNVIKTPVSYAPPCQSSPHPTINLTNLSQKQNDDNPKLLSIGVERRNNDTEEYIQKELLVTGTTSKDADMIVSEMKNIEHNDKNDENEFKIHETENELQLPQAPSCTKRTSPPAPSYSLLSEYPKRKPGRPPIIRSGKPGRPPKPKTAKLLCQTRKQVTNPIVTIHNESSPLSSRTNADSDDMTTELGQTIQANSIHHPPINDNQPGLINATISVPLKDKGGRPRYEKTGKKGRPRKIRKVIDTGINSITIETPTRYSSSSQCSDIKVGEPDQVNSPIPLTRMRTPPEFPTNPVAPNSDIQSAS